MNDDLVAALERERMTGLPRWHIASAPVAQVAPDPLADITARRKVLRRDYDERDLRLREANAEIMRGTAS